MATTCARHDHGGKCRGHNHKTGEPCGNWPLKGGSVCGMHGGSAPQVKAAAAQRVLEAKATQAVATLGLPADVTPQEALLEEVGRSAGAVRWLEGRVRELDPDAVTWDRSATITGRQAAGNVDFTEYRAVPHALLVVYQAERRHLVDVCKVAIAAGIEERRVHLAERLGEVFADSITALLDELGLTPEQRELARVAVPARLRLLAGDLDRGEAS